MQNKKKEKKRLCIEKRILAGSDIIN